MSVSIKTAQEIELMRESGHLLEKVHDGLIPYIKPGMSTKEIDRIGEDMIRSMGCIPNFLNYGGFPAFANFIPSKKHCLVTSISCLASLETSPTA